MQRLPMRKEDTSEIAPIFKFQTSLQTIRRKEDKVEIPDIILIFNFKSN
jgi:hypothetical protein